MLFATLLTATTLLLTASAAPTTPALEKRGKGAECWGQNNVFWQSMTVNMYGWGNERDGCGKGLLDNLKGQCSHAITNWHCNDAGSGNAHAIFNIPVSRAHCVEDAIWLASGGVGGVQCKY